MKKIVFVVILICAAFLLIGCQTKGRAVAGQRLWGGWAGQELQTDTEFPSSVTDFRSLEMPVEYVESEIKEHMDCMVASVTIREGSGHIGHGDSEGSAKLDCISLLAKDLWVDADMKCFMFYKEDGTTSCQVASGTLNPQKDIKSDGCSMDATTNTWTCLCSLNKDKDYVCNSH